MSKHGSAESGRFQTTPWTKIERAARRATAEDEQALEVVLKLYLPAIRAHLTRKLWGNLEKARDLSQSFVHDRVLLNSFLAKARRGEGRFRTFLLIALDRFLADEIDKEKTIKRGGHALHVALDSVSEEEFGAADDGPELFQLTWIRTLLDEVIRRMKAECEENERREVWAVFEGRLLRDALDVAAPVPYDVLLERYPNLSLVQIYDKLTKGKAMFTRHLEDVVGEYERGGSRAVRAELEELKHTLARLTDDGKKSRRGAQSRPAKAVKVSKQKSS